MATLLLVQLACKLGPSTNWQYRLGWILTCEQPKLENYLTISRKRSEIDPVGAMGVLVRFS